MFSKRINNDKKKNKQFLKIKPAFMFIETRGYDNIKYATIDLNREKSFVDFVCRWKVLRVLQRNYNSFCFYKKYWNNE
jgi:hypothetical protein